MSAPSAERREIGLPVVSVLGTATLVAAWAVRKERYLTAEEGLGYALGVAGLACMTLLLLYSVRKRAGFMRHWGPLRRWFGVHMLLGLLGPLAILLHSNFRLGSLNSTVSFACVLLVAASGIVGRIIYPKIHHGLSDRRASLRDLRAGADARRASLRGTTEAWPELEKRLDVLESWAAAPVPGIPSAIARYVALGPRMRSARREGRAIAGEASAAIDDYLGEVRRVVEYRVCERLFALWHAVHLPLCVILFVAAVIHVVAVHLY